ncbi:MAG: hypothetical protein FWH21_04720 [Kiritimatiellaeota bacterium]|nr:hypothetical protein [Kiritimatiellota bacterium]
MQCHLLVVVLGLLTGCASAEKTVCTSGRVWTMPRTADFVRMLDNVDQWPETAKITDVFGGADHALNRMYTDEELSRAFRALKDNGMRLGLEVGAVKPWGKTGAKVFEIQRPMWERFNRLGGDVFALALDEPLVAVTMHMAEENAFETMTPEERFEYAVEETATFIALVRQHYPHILIGDIEVYPSLKADVVIAWLDALEARLKAKGVRGQDFFRLDVNWVAFPVQDGSWEDFMRIENHCKKIGMPFSMIFWASDLPGDLQKRDDPTAWYKGIMRQGEDYLKLGNPDQYVIETWLDAPPEAFPETKEWTFTRSVIDFYNVFIKEK